MKKREWIKEGVDHKLMVGDCNFGQVFEGVSGVFICQTILHGVIGGTNNLEAAKMMVESSASETEKTFSLT